MRRAGHQDVRARICLALRYARGPAGAAFGTIRGGPDSIETHAGADPSRHMKVRQIAELSRKPQRLAWLPVARETLTLDTLPAG